MFKIFSGRGRPPRVILFLISFYSALAAVERPPVI